MRAMIFGLCGMALAALLCAAELRQSQRPAEASDIKLLSKARKNLPTPREKEINRQKGDLESAAAAALNAGDFAGAETEARQALSWGSGSGRGREALAASLYAQGKTDEALQAYEVMADNTQLPYLDEGDLVRRYSNFFANVPRPADLEAAIHIGLGLTMNGGDFHGTYQDRARQALTHFQRAVALEPGDALRYD